MVDEAVTARDSAGWGARCRVGDDGAWSDCRLVDITLTGALIELADDVPDGSLDELPFFLQIDSIAEDEVGIIMRAVIRRVEQDDGRSIADIEFSGGREERILLHLLVRLHTLV